MPTSPADSSDPTRHDPSVAPASIIESSDHAIIGRSNDGTVTIWSRGAARLFGIPAPEAIGRRLNMLLPETHEDEPAELLGRVARGEYIEHLETRRLTRDGATVDVALSLSPMLAPDGTVVGSLTIGRDITDRKHADRALYEREARIRAIFDTALDGIITINRRGLIESVNGATERLFGYPAADLIGNNVSMLMPSPYREAHDGYLARAAATGHAPVVGMTREVAGLRRDGTTFPMELSVSEVDHMHIYVGVVRDITSRKRAEERLHKADRLASVGSLAAGLGHDISNVLLPVRTHLAIIESMDQPEAMREHLDAIHRSVRYMLKLTGSLHLLALDPDDPDASAPTTDVADWWDRHGPLLAQSLPSGVRLVASIPHAMPEAAIAPHQLTQAVLNLLVNASDAVSASGTVRVWADAADGHVRVAVTDDGVGMTPEVRRHALDAFFTTKKRGLGTGLGLSIVNGIVGGVGGTVSIESEPGAGTTVVLEVPAVAHDPHAGRAVLDAVITVADDRFAGLVGVVLRAAGITARRADEADPATTALWICDGTPARADALAAFAAMPDHVVVCCDPTPGLALPDRVLRIEKAAPFDTVRARLGEAVDRFAPDRPAAL
ncbi:MAG: PAS domain S-box protein [Phycisphaerales bacterium]|nr:PAS domain S-box protein [Phycisphaerales bacterium]